jgi:hypothetical protein
VIVGGKAVGRYRGNMNLDRRAVILSEAKEPRPLDGTNIVAVTTIRPLRCAQGDIRTAVPPYRRTAPPTHNHG